MLHQINIASSIVEISNCKFWQTWSIAHSYLLLREEHPISQLQLVLLYRRQSHRHVHILNQTLWAKKVFEKTLSLNFELLEKKHGARKRCVTSNSLQLSVTTEEEIRSQWRKDEITGRARPSRNEQAWLCACPLVNAIALTYHAPPTQSPIGGWWLTVWRHRRADATRGASRDDRKDAEIRDLYHTSDTS